MADLRPRFIQPGSTQGATNSVIAAIGNQSNAVGSLAKLFQNERDRADKLNQQGILNARADAEAVARAKQNEVSNKNAEALLRLRQAEGKRAQTTYDQEQKLFRENEAMAKAIVNTPTTGTNANTILKQTEAKKAAEILAVNELEKSGGLGLDYAARVKAAEDAQILAAQEAVAGGYGVIPTEGSQVSANPGSVNLDRGFGDSLLGRLFNKSSSGQVASTTNVPGFAPSVTGSVDDRIVQYRQDNPVDYEGIRAAVYTDGKGNELVQDVRPENLSIDAPRNDVRLSDTVIKQNRINQVKGLADQGIISNKAAAEYIMKVNAPTSLDERKFQLKERELKAKIDSGYFKKSKKNKNGTSISDALSKTVDAHAIGEFWDSAWTTDKDDLVKDARGWKDAGYKDHEIGAAIKASMDTEGHVDTDDVYDYLLNIY